MRHQPHPHQHYDPAGNRVQRDRLADHDDCGGQRHQGLQIQQRSHAGRPVVTLGRNVVRRHVTQRSVWCHHPWEIVFLDPQANVRPCVNWGAEPVLGNALEQSLEEILEGPAYARIRAELRGDLPKREVCLHCPAVVSGKVDESSAFETRPG